MGADKILDNIQKGLASYEEDVKRMTDPELWEHCFDDDGAYEHDFCIQELKRRFLDCSESCK